MPERKKAGRRSNNEGCIRQRPNGLWEAQYIVAYKPDGHPIRRSIYGQKKSEVRMKLRDILLSIERDEYIEPSHLTVGDWLEEWFRIYCLPHKKASTCTGYEEEIYLHLKPYIGRVP